MSRVMIPLARTMAQFVERSWAIAIPVLKRMERG